MGTITSNQRRLLTEITTYNYSMRHLRTKLEGVMLDDSLLCGMFRLERTILANGYEFFALYIHTTLLGIVDVRSNLWKVIPPLTAYCHWLGFRHNNVRHVKYGAFTPYTTPTRRCVGGKWVRDVWKPRDLPKLFEVE